MYRILINNDTDIIHALDPFFADTGEFLTLCGHVGSRFGSITVSGGRSKAHMVESVNCKNCLRSLGAYTFQRKRINRTMKVYEYGRQDSDETPVWIKTNRKIRLTTLLIEEDVKYLKEIDIKHSGERSGVDLVIT